MAKNFVIQKAKPRSLTLKFKSVKVTTAERNRNIWSLLLCYTVQCHWYLLTVLCKYCYISAAAHPRPVQCCIFVQLSVLLFHFRWTPSIMESPKIRPDEKKHCVSSGVHFHSALCTDTIKELLSKSIEHVSCMCNIGTALYLLYRLSGQDPGCSCLFNILYMLQWSCSFQLLLPYLNWCRICGWTRYTEIWCHLVW